MRFEIPVEDTIHMLKGQGGESFICTGCDAKYKRSPEALKHDPPLEYKTYCQCPQIKKHAPGYRAFYQGISNRSNEPCLACRVERHELCHA